MLLLSLTLTVQSLCTAWTDQSRVLIRSGERRQARRGRLCCAGLCDSDYLRISPLSYPLLSSLPASTKSPAEVVNCEMPPSGPPGGIAPVLVLVLGLGLQPALSDRKRNCVVGVLSSSVRGISTQEMLLLQLHSTVSQS